MSLFKVGDPFGVAKANELKKLGYGSSDPLGEGEVRAKIQGGKYTTVISIAGKEYQLGLVAEEILSRLKDVDGPGSGLDADKVDGCDVDDSRITTENLWTAEKINSLLTGGGGIPSGMIAIFDTSCPVGWTRVAAFDSKFLRGADTYGGTGGSETHKHSINPPSTNTSPDGSHYHSIDPPNTSSSDQSTNHTHGINFSKQYVKSAQDGSPIEVVTNIDSPSQGISTNHTHSINIAAFNSAAAGSHSHTVDINVFDSEEANNLPPYIDVVFCRKD